MILSFLLSVLLQDLPSSKNIAVFQDVTTQKHIVLSTLPVASIRKFLPPIKKNIDGKESLGVEITARAGIVLDVKSGAVLFSKDYNVKSSIASITKLMTALVFLEYNPGWDTKITMSIEDERNGASSRIYRGEETSVKDLFYASLVSSDNNSTMALVRSTGLSEKEFVDKMNEKAKFLGLRDTVFEDPTGLLEGNVSTSMDIAKLIYNAMLNEEISKATTRPVYSVSIYNKSTQRKIYNTDTLLDSYINKAYEIKGGKTGFTNEAGSCLGVMVNNKKGNDIIVVVMGSENNSMRFNEVKALTQWAFDNYSWN